MIDSHSNRESQASSGEQASAVARTSAVEGDAQAVDDVVHKGASGHSRRDSGIDLNFEIERAYKELLGTGEEFVTYGAYRKRLLVRLLQRSDAIAATLSSEIQAVSSAVTRLETARPLFDQSRRLRLVGSALIMLFTGVPACLYVIQFVRGSGSMPMLAIDMPFLSRNGWNLVSAAALLLLGAAVLRLVWSNGFNPQARDHLFLKEEVVSARKELSDSLSTIVAIELRSIIPDELADEVRFIFSGTAPAMVELDNARIAPARSIEYLSRFVAVHESSAVGVAGARGIGKTTALRALAVSTSDSVGVYISAPVRYEPTDFVRRILEEVAEQVIGEAPPSLMRQTVPTARLTAIGGLLTAAFLLILFGVNPTLAQVALPNLVIAGIALGLLASTILVNEFLRAARARNRRRYRRALGHAGGLAWQALEQLRYKREISSTSSTSFKPLGGLLELKDDESLSRTSRDKSRAELVGDLRRFLRELHLASGKRIVIAIDELDKLAEPQDIIGVVNDIKDLFHIKGVHFLVSVSTDAMDSFAMRGVPSRDAFDSAFDTIYMIERMTARESVRVLRGRATGFPIPLALFAHAWAGGLPRDLLRCARGCVEAYDRLSIELRSTDEIVRQVLRTDVDLAVDALVRRSLLATSEETGRDKVVEEMISSMSGQPFAQGAQRLAEGGRDVPRAIQRPVAAMQRYVSLAALIEETYGLKAIPVGDWHRLVDEDSQLATSDELARRKASIGYGLGIAHSERLSGVEERAVPAEEVEVHS